jgi:hypothetical protein
MSDAETVFCGCRCVWSVIFANPGGRYPETMGTYYYRVTTDETTNVEANGVE